MDMFHHPSTEGHPNVCKYCRDYFPMASIARQCEAQHEAIQAEWRRKAEFTRIYQVLMYTHPQLPAPILWDIAGETDFNLALRELFYFLDSRGCYEELSDKGMKAHTLRRDSLRELVPALAEGTIPSALICEASYKVEKFLPDAEKTCEEQQIQRLLLDLARDGHDQAVFKLLDMRKTRPEETWVLLPVRKPTGAKEPAQIEAPRPRYIIVLADGTAVPYDPAPLEEIIGTVPVALLETADEYRGMGTEKVPESEDVLGETDTRL